MKVVQKTSTKIVLEVQKEEIDRDGFDGIWDRVREWYSAEKFDVFSISKDKGKDGVFFIELKNKIEED